LHARERTDDLDEREYYIISKHAIFTFQMDGFLLDHEGISPIRIEWLAR